ncbi:MAG: Glycoside hydrolase family 48 [Microgenomates group bacterium GW2011_GWC1_39_7b]|uniref:Glycoside hydrolase family 48 n=1 Tax=Candidatus Woesebacteria bacterium GW2011_GWA1_43_12 TaxID=1618557 RepID=A0A0G1CY87_9BACT|nr:MAG: Glycoside hydrolase family 48 [Microgenomates group bacterium GW2011_GWC1_39_7b]KKS90715.1 MAG: Glycoside hydrolase family 48 [Candidatus Woesebacteria bacterium GW2011_GWA1_43_12]
MKGTFFLIVVCLLFFLVPANSGTQAQSSLFEDNFNTNPNGSVPNSWTIDGPSGWNVQNGMYGINTAGVSNTVPKDEYWDSTWKNISFDVDAMWMSGQDKNIIFHYIGTYSFYEIHYNEDDGGTFHIDRHIDQTNGASVATPLKNYHLNNGVLYHFRVELSDNHIKIFEGANTLFDIQDNTPNPILGGKIGLRAGGTEVWFDNVVVTEISAETPTPSPTPTPTPSPTPSPTPTPVTKVFLIPGTGASWNVDALINCKESGYSGDWTMAPYAKEVYSQLLSSLTAAGWDTTTFNYDWRKQVPENSSLFSNFVNSNVGLNEKADIVSHSLGGLIGRNYLESQSGGKASKLLTVGTPHKGLAITYPAVVNNEIWANDLVEKIAATLLFKHCGVPASFKNMLPIYDYLRNSKTNQLKDVNSMETKNNYLPTNFVSPFWGVKVGTLAGTGKRTLKIIDVIKNSSWPDGKPVGRENVNEGDGMVLIDSAQIPGAASNEVINQSHSGIIASTEGVSKILEFLGAPGIEDPPYFDPTSALILVGYPGNFWITDRNGVTTQSDKGMIAIMNPEDGNYRLQMIPTSGSTSFIVAQFLPNGKTLYKEYKFKGIRQNPKVIEFSSKNPKENILNSPKSWFEY